MSLPFEFQNANKKLESYAVIREPFEHFLVEDIFSPDFYTETLRQLPDDSAYSWSATKKSTGEKHRGRISLNPQALKKLPETQREFWSSVSNWMLSDSFSDLMMGKFENEIQSRFNGEKKGSRVFAELKLLRDKVNYSLRPHTDSLNRVLTLMIYLPRDDKRANNGTAIYKPKQEGFRCAGGGRHEFADFDLVGKAPFMPNSGFCFLKSDRSFHGVEMVDEQAVQRDLLAFTIRCVKETPRQRLERLFASVRGAEEVKPVRSAYMA